MIMRKIITTKYSDDKEFYYEISIRFEGNYEVVVFQKVVYDDYGDTLTTYHDIKDGCHITYTIERAVEIGDEILCTLTDTKKEKI